MDSATGSRIVPEWTRAEVASSRESRDGGMTWLVAGFAFAAALYWGWDVTRPPKPLPDRRDIRVSRTVPIVLSLGFVATGAFLVAKGEPSGWPCLLFFGFCTLVFLLVPGVDQGGREYEVAIHADEVVLTTDGRREAMPWNDVVRIVLATTSDGPWLPDVWLIFVDRSETTLAVPTEATGFDRFFDVLGERFPGFDFEPFVVAGTDDAMYDCWPSDDDLDPSATAIGADDVR